MGSSSSAITGRHLTIVIAMLALLIGGYFGLRHLMRPPTQPTVDEGRAIVEAFLANIREGKAGEAWDASSTEFKSIEGRESFTRKSKTTDLLREPLQFGSTQDVKVQNTPRTEFLYTSSKSGKTVRVLVSYEGDGWKVDRLIY